MPVQIDFHKIEKLPQNQEIAAKAVRLKQLGLNHAAVDRRLDVGYETVVKAVAWTEISET